MDVKRGKGPEKVQRPISVELNRNELLDVIGSFIKRKLNAEIDITAIKGMGSGADNVLDTVVFSGIETVTLNWERKVVDPPQKPVTNGQ